MSATEVLATAALPCPRHKCGDCGRFIPSATVAHGSGFEYHDDWAAGTCSKCGRVDVLCVPYTEQETTK